MTRCMNKKIKFRIGAFEIGFFIILIFALISIFAEHIAPYDPTIMGIAYLPPSTEHLLGTNDVGQDIFSELIYGTRVSLFIGFFAALIVTVAGTVLALVAGYYGGPVDRIITAVTNIAMAIPDLPLTILLVAFLKPGKWNIIIAISITAWTSTARVLKSRVMQLKEEPFIKVERALGLSDAFIMFRHILPNIADIVLIRGVLAISSAMLTESGLSFLGLGSIGEKSWGSTLRYAFFRNSIIKGQWWWYLPPILCISTAVLGFMLLGYYGLVSKDKKGAV